MQITITITGKADKDCEYCCGSGRIIRREQGIDEECGCTKKSRTMSFDEAVELMAAASAGKYWSVMTKSNKNEFIREQRIALKAILPTEGKE